MSIPRMNIAFLCLLVTACNNPFGFVDEDRRMILRGVVTNAVGKAPLAGVYVSLEWRPESQPGPGSGPVIHVDTSTGDDGSYRVEAKLNEVNCSTVFLRVASSGFRSVLVHPDCRSGEQTFDLALTPS
jgi:hypothetical protein